MAVLDLVLVVGIIAGIYALLAIGLNLQWGDAGILNFAHVAFFMIGAYTSAILASPTSESAYALGREVGFNLPIAAGIVAGTVVAGLVGVIVALFSVRVDGDYLAMITLAFAEGIWLVVKNEEWLTGGSLALSGIPRPLSGALPVNYDLFYFLLVWVAVGGSYLAFRRLSRSPFGRVLHAVREDDKAALSLGKNTMAYKLKAFGLGAALAGFAGTLLAHYMYAIVPTMFVLVITLEIWIAVIVGGSGSYEGVILGTLFVLGVGQATRYLPQGIPFSGELPYVRQILIGVILILVLYYRPNGILGDSTQVQAMTEET
jgi:branched-chain amino acid transport system permease protein